MDDYWLHKLRQYRTTSSPSRCDQFVYFDLCLPSQWESQSRTWFAALPVPPGLLPGINSKSSNTQQVPWRPQQQGIQVSSTSSWPYWKAAGLTCFHMVWYFPRWLKRCKSSPRFILSSVEVRGGCPGRPRDFFLGKGNPKVGSKLKIIRFGSIYIRYAS